MTKGSGHPWVTVAMLTSDEIPIPNLGHGCSRSSDGLWRLNSYNRACGAHNAANLRAYVRDRSDAPLSGPAPAQPAPRSGGDRADSVHPALDSV
jgi:hypothetical protein